MTMLYSMNPNVPEILFCPSRTRMPRLKPQAVFWAGRRACRFSVLFGPQQQPGDLWLLPDPPETIRLRLNEQHVFSKRRAL